MTLSLDQHAIPRSSTPPPAQSERPSVRPLEPSSLPPGLAGASGPALLAAAPPGCELELTAALAWNAAPSVPGLALPAVGREQPLLGETRTPAWGGNLTV